MKLLAGITLLIVGCQSIIKCPRDGFFRDPEDCGKYYRCHLGQAYSNSCPSGLQFNVDTGTCDWPRSANCKEGPTEPPTEPEPTTPPAPTTPPGPTEPKPEGEKEVVCYFVNWAYYRPGDGKYLPEDIDPALCTVVIYAFSTLGGNGKLQVHDSWADLTSNFYKRTVALKKKPGSRVSKVLLAIGGWNDSGWSGSGEYSKMIKTRKSRKAFIDHVVPFLLDYGFDGLDLDWEYPVCWQGECRNGRPEEKRDFATWCAELKAAFRPHGLQLSAAVSANRIVIDAGYDVPRLARSLDFLNVMTYDFHGSWEKLTGHNAPMYRCKGDHKPNHNTDAAINYFLQAGFPARKIMLGLPIYGRSWTLKDSSQNGLGAPAIAGGTKGPWTRATGLLGYYEICLNLKDNGWTEVKGSSCTVGAYAYKGDQWVGYDDLDAVKYKMEYIKKKGLGGGMVWDTSTDDFKGNCGQGKNPFLTAMREHLA